MQQDIPDREKPGREEEELPDQANAPQEAPPFEEEPTKLPQEQPAEQPGESVETPDPDSVERPDDLAGAAMTPDDVGGG